MEKTEKLAAKMMDFQSPLVINPKIINLLPQADSSPIMIRVINKFDKEKDFSIFGSAFSSFESLSEKYLDQAEVESDAAPYSFIQKDILTNKYPIGKIRVAVQKGDDTFLKDGFFLTYLNKNIKGAWIQDHIPIHIHFKPTQFQTGIIEALQPIIISGSMSLSGKIPARTTMTFNFFPDELYEFRICDHPFAKTLIDKINSISHKSDYNYSKMIPLGLYGSIPLAPDKVNYFPSEIEDAISKFRSNRFDVYHSMVNLYSMLDQFWKRTLKEHEEKLIRAREELVVRNARQDRGLVAAKLLYDKEVEERKEEKRLAKRIYSDLKNLSNQTSKKHSVKQKVTKKVQAKRILKK